MMEYCAQCERYFKSLKGLQKHLETSGKHVDYHCHRCQRRFTSPAAKGQHLLTSSSHNFCTQCSDAPDFESLGYLEEHMAKTHFYCSYCKTSFTDRAQLIDHEASAHHVCPTCHARFDSRSNLKYVSSLCEVWVSHRHHAKQVI
jgi:DNA-directed RNA polymerase subunit RPC12/RpoP